MGNNLTTDITFYDHDDKARNKSKLSKFICMKSKLKTFTSTTRNIYEAPIIEYLKENNEITDLTSFDQRRAVFVSLIGLFQTWKQCPCYLLYSALIIVPLRREYIYYPSKYMNEIQSHCISTLSAFSDPIEIKQFIQFLKWKDTQQLVFWMLDDYNNEPHPNNTLIQPFWFALNNKLTQLYDPITKTKYKPLNLNAKYWQNRNRKFGTNGASILCELYFLQMKFKTIQEIIYDSNPKSLNPIKAYNNKSIATMNVSMDELFDEFDTNDKIENWWISEDYDPYDVTV